MSEFNYDQDCNHLNLDSDSDSDSDSDLDSNSDLDSDSDSLVGYTLYDYSGINDDEWNILGKFIDETKKLNLDIDNELLELKSNEEYSLYHEIAIEILYNKGKNILKQLFDGDFEIYKNKYKEFMPIWKKYLLQILKSFYKNYKKKNYRFMHQFFKNEIIGLQLNLDDDLFDAEIFEISQQDNNIYEQEIKESQDKYDFIEKFKNIAKKYDKSFLEMKDPFDNKKSIKKYCKNRKNFEKNLKIYNERIKNIKNTKKISQEMKIQKAVDDKKNNNTKETPSQKVFLNKDIVDEISSYYGGKLKNKSKKSKKSIKKFRKTKKSTKKSTKKTRKSHR